MKNVCLGQTDVYHQRSFYVCSEKYNTKFNPTDGDPSSVWDLYRYLLLNINEISIVTKITNNT